MKKIRSVSKYYCSIYTNGHPQNILHYHFVLYSISAELGETPKKP